MLYSTREKLSALVEGTLSIEAVLGLLVSAALTLIFGLYGELTGLKLMVCVYAMYVLPLFALLSSAMSCDQMFTSVVRAVTAGWPGALLATFVAVFTSATFGEMIACVASTLLTLSFGALLVSVVIDSVISGMKGRCKDRK